MSDPTFENNFDDLLEKPSTNTISDTLTTFENNFDDLLEKPSANTISDTLTDVDVSNPFHDAVSPLRPASSADDYFDNIQSTTDDPSNDNNNRSIETIQNPLEHGLTAALLSVDLNAREDEEEAETKNPEEEKRFEDVDVSSVTGIAATSAPRSDSEEENSEGGSNEGPHLEEGSVATSSSSQSEIRHTVTTTFEISVEDPVQIGDNLTGYILYNVRTITNSPDFKSRDFTVQRRYRDFLWLYNQLTLNKPGVIVPPVPEKHIYVLAAARFQNEFVENRRKALEKCLNKIVSHPELQNDLDLHLFLESNTFTTDLRRNESRGVLRSLSDAMSSATGFNKFTETDEYFETRRNQLDILESQLKALLKSVEAIVKQRKELGGATKEFGESMLTLGCAEYEKNKTIANNLTILGNLQHKIKDLHEFQAQRDVVMLENTVDEYIRIIGSIKVAVNSRAKCYLNWQNGTLELQKKKANYERMKTQGKLRHDRLSTMLADVADSERKVEDYKHEFERVTKLLKAELDRFDKEKVEDFKNSLEGFLESMVHTQKEIIALWESYFKAVEVEQGIGLEQSVVSAI